MLIREYKDLVVGQMKEIRDSLLKREDEEGQNYNRSDLRSARYSIEQAIERLR